MKYKFNQIETALVAFIGNLRIKINSFEEFTSKYGTIPVMMLENGDETYTNLNKNKSEQKEQYLKVPRVVVNIEDLSIEQDQDTNRIIPVNYILPKDNSNEIWTGSFRRKAISIPVTLNFVCSSYIQALEFQELVLTFLTIENITTYNWLANDYPLDYNMTTISVERNSMDMGGTKNVVVKVSIDLKLALMIPKYNTLEKIGETLSHTGNEGNVRDKNNNNINQGNQNNNGNNQGNNSNNDNNNNDSGRLEKGKMKPKFDIHSKLPDDPIDEYTYVTTLDPDKTLN